jgi:hypothetical protein
LVKVLSCLLVYLYAWFKKYSILIISWAPAIPSEGIFWQLHSLMCKLQKLTLWSLVWQKSFQYVMSLYINICLTCWND